MLVQGVRHLLRIAGHLKQRGQLRGGRPLHLRSQNLLNGRGDGRSAAAAAALLRIVVEEIRLQLCGHGGGPLARHPEYLPEGFPDMRICVRDAEAQQRPQRREDPMQQAGAITITSRAQTALHAMQLTSPGTPSWPERS